ncbi:MAG: sulfurtransferase TusA family protein [Rhodobacteraceae bacterium]|nr:sulfurtransferase TusA family protein [Paracoccaceae bacterium]
MDEFDDQLDAIGLLCPLPVLKARKRLMAMGRGKVLKVLCDDPAAIVDIPHYCAESGHTLIGQGDGDGFQYYLIRKVG